MSGSVHSRILANLGKTRIEVLASAVHGGRTITLIRTFELEIRTAFTIVANAVPVKLTPGSAAMVRLQVDRVKTFTGPVKVTLSPSGGLEYPETVTIPHGQDGVDVEVKAQAGIGPGRRSIFMSATGEVDGFEEEQRGTRIEIEIPRPEKPKKK